MSQETIGNVLLMLAAVPANIAVVAYHLSTRRRATEPETRRWWESPWGRHLMTYMIAVALVFDLGVIRIYFGDSRWFDGLRVAAYVLLVAALYQRMWLMIQAYREGPPTDRPVALPER